MKKLKLSKQTIKPLIRFQDGHIFANASTSSQNKWCSCEQHCEQARRDTVHDCDPSVGCGSGGCDSVHDCL